MITVYSIYVLFRLALVLPKIHCVYPNTAQYCVNANTKFFNYALNKKSYSLLLRRIGRNRAFSDGSWLSRLRGTLSDAYVEVPLSRFAGHRDSFASHSYEWFALLHPLLFLSLKVYTTILTCQGQTSASGDALNFYISIFYKAFLSVCIWMVKSFS